MSKTKQAIGTIQFYRARGQYGYLSNLYPCPVTFEGRTFRSSEEAYQYGKPSRKDIADWMVSAPTESLVAIVAHHLPTYEVRVGWQDTKVERMMSVVRQKFLQNRGLAKKLLSTGSAELIEASPRDSFWGIGRNRDGKNVLGRILMQTRAALRRKP